MSIEQPAEPIKQDATIPALANLLERALMDLPMDFDQQAQKYSAPTITAKYHPKVLAFATKYFDSLDDKFSVAVITPQRVCDIFYEIGNNLSGSMYSFSDENHFTEAELFLNYGLKLSHTLSGSNKSHTANYLHALGNVFLKTNRFAEAEEFYRKAVAADDICPMDNMKDAIAHLLSLALFLRDTNRKAEAKQFFLRALTLCNSAYQVDDYDLCCNLSIIAHSFASYSSQTEAEPVIRRIIELETKKSKVEANTDYDSTKQYNLYLYWGYKDLANILLETQRFEEAEKTLRAVVEQATLSNRKLKACASMGKLAWFLHQTNRFVEAEVLFLEAVALTACDSQDYSTPAFNSYIDLADFLKATNRHSEAEPFLRLALESCENCPEQDRLNCALALGKLAILLKEMNRPTETEPLFRRALAIYADSYYPNHPERTTLLNSFSAMLQEHNQQDELAQLRYREPIFEDNRYGPGNPDTASNISACSGSNPDETEHNFRFSVFIDETYFGPTHPRVAIRLANLGKWLKSRNQMDDAVPLLQRAADLFELNYGKDHPITLKCMERLNSDALNK